VNRVEPTPMQQPPMQQPPMQPMPLPSGWGVPEVGSFRQGSEASRYALARYLVGRAAAESMSHGLLVLGLVVLAAAGLLEWRGAGFWAVVVAILALGVLAMRALLAGVLNRLTAVAADGPSERRLRAVLKDTRADVLRELRRVGLPGRTWSMPLLALRLLRPSRQRQTVTRLRQFEIERAVPPARLDEVHLLLRARLRG
jgi:hypothetical protein